ncbi:MAG: threonylcarbamoyl-AMP synthase [Deltaproteobacteria bacterium RIFCSPLOWO2_12_FULL_43_16]|nr:MAG: threonylcarbamoyl-AMP synthase [Deltaproteobacteria bacterium GWA2_43_19]OGQ11573.1 MAG: threonylcarbamoyl-AMP synthase [Deltaproteobacteria bacterium RIFCSPHIGHO2_02_FULL_43_33]OGQ39157.1 MAG: threonylcarbamoyl-AMP synthase [Deltaproteobacteria bacterium RIFCSPLOWO2_01_FULL_42_9]OGQ59458.1 MAG: threonylcarbamoyl-AMP synthase [Deltaproteobacteria bacterium RIFCSPLOWO2_12_FULL_43_16]HBR18338.1 threonylcarbamoyl-AMP synthase [Deltaproteobacteria bacterium]
MTTLLKAETLSGSDWKRVRDIFKKGGIIAYPTETFYGLGVDPFNEAAIKKLFELKGRGSDKPVSILIKDKKMLLEVAEEIPLLAEKLIKKFWPGPLTIIFKAKKSIPSLLTGGTGKIGVRISSNPITQKLLEEIDSPITATSANPSGKKSPVTAKEVMDYFGDKIDLLIDGGVLSGKLGSTILDATEQELKVIREGEIPAKDVFEAIMGR